MPGASDGLPASELYLLDLIACVQPCTAPAGRLKIKPEFLKMLATCKPGFRAEQKRQLQGRRIKIKSFGVRKKTRGRVAEAANYIGPV